MILDKFRKFEFVNIMQGAHNISFILRETLTNFLWIGKISKNLKERNVDFIDLDDRAILTYRLGKKLKTCIPATKVINYNQINFSPLFNEFLKSIKSDSVLMQNKLLITKFKGITLSNFLKFSEINKIKNLRQVLYNFVFNLWVGNYDKKNEDYVIDNNYFCHSIDYNLSGPGFHTNKKLSLGAYAQSYGMDDVCDTGWAIAPLFIKEIKDKQYKVDFFDPEIKKIENISDKTIKNAFGKLNFFKHSTKKRLNNEFVEFLINRKSKIRNAINNWCIQNYKRGVRPKEKPQL